MCLLKYNSQYETKFVKRNKIINLYEPSQKQNSNRFP